MPPLKTRGISQLTVEKINHPDTPFGYPRLSGFGAMINAMDKRKGERMSTGGHSPPHRPTQYVIRVRGHLDPAWSEWLDGLEIAHEPGGDSRLSGTILDQAALYGLLAKLRDLGLTLLSVYSVYTASSRDSPDQ